MKIHVVFVRKFCSASTETFLAFSMISVLALSQQEYLNLCNTEVFHRQTDAIQNIARKQIDYHRKPVQLKQNG